MIFVMHMKVFVPDSTKTKKVEKDLQKILREPDSVTMGAAGASSCQKRWLLLLLQLYLNLAGSFEEKSGCV